LSEKTVLYGMLTRN